MKDLNKKHIKDSIYLDGLILIHVKEINMISDNFKVMNGFSYSILNFLFAL